MPLIVCRPKSLPVDKLAAAATRAVEINPDNAAGRRQVARTPTGRRGGPRRIAVVTDRKWPRSGVRLSVSFMDNPSGALRARILLHMNAWGESANVVFSETQGTGEVRIARLDSPASMAGYWSYIGTEVLSIDESEPTLNLEGFTMRVSEAEFRRVVRHEAGHTLGFEHEHMRSDIVKRIDRERAIAFFDRTEGWTEQEVEEQVLTPLPKASIMGTTDSDPLSIMCYQLPASIMKDRKEVKGGSDINTLDFAFAKKIYPKDLGDAKAPAAPPPVLEVVSQPPPDDAVDTFHLIVMDEFRPEDAGGAAASRSPKRAQILASYGGARVTSTLRLRADKGEEKTQFGRIIGMHERIKAYTNREQGSLPGDDEMIQFGGQLFETLLQGDVRRLYDEARTRQGRRRLDFVLTSMIPWISEKPWEFAFDTGRRSFLATEEIHFVRNVLTNVPADPIVRPRGPLRILVAAAQPVGFGRLSIDQEVEVIRRGFAPLVDAGLVAIDVIARTTPEEIHAYLKTATYQIVHFIGHGVYNEERREGCLVFENDRGGEFMLGERALREIFCKRGLSLVFLNACESGRGGRADFNKGVAQSLVAHGLPALVANQYSVLDSSATSFARHFYASLAQGLSIGESAREARIAVNYSLHGEPIDWAIPVLYARDPGMTLTAPGPARTPGPLIAAKAARRGARRDAQIAVWDIDDVFPRLDDTLNAMNGAQSVFGFELVDLSVPLDVWDLNKTEGTAYLWAEHVARRLQGKPAELNADILACVTRHWLRDDDTLNLYGWWPDGGKPPVIIFSVAGFDQLPPEGPDTSRAVRNALVTGLAGFYGDVGTHATGAKNCPLAFNENRLYEHLIGRLKFDAVCRRKLSKGLGARLGALDALLALE
jgi:CHAT domain-containing protein